jgi:SPP1 gp7 family putative phage head morphogenesis protein
MPKKSLNEIIHDELIKRTARMTRVEAQISSEAVKVLQELADSLASMLGGVNWDSGTVPRKLARLQRLQKQVDAEIMDYFGNLSDTTDSYAREIATSEAKFIGKTFNDAIGVEIFNVTLNKGLLKTLTGDVMITDSPASAWWAKQSDDLAFNFMREMRAGIQLGEPLGELVRRVRGRKEYGFADGLLGYNSSATRNAEALIRTSVMTVMNDTRQAMYEQNEDLLQGYMWSSTLDLRVCPSCRARDGAMYDLEGKALNAIAKKLPFQIPPIHFGDRCGIIGVPKSWEQLAKESGGNTKLGKQLDKIDDGTRASMDGQVPDSVTFADWIKGKDKTDPGAVEAMFGSARYKLWKEGKMPLTGFLDNKGNPLTLEEL